MGGLGETAGHEGGHSPLAAGSTSKACAWRLATIWRFIFRDPEERDALVAGLDGPAQRLSESAIGRIWRKFELKPHLTDGFKRS